MSFDVRFDLGAARSGRIDVHHHLIPPPFIQAMSRHGIDSVAGAPLPQWTPERSLRVMDAHGIATAVTSLSAPGVYFGNLDEACALARQCNEYSAELKQRHPGRFGSFAVLPMPFTSRACSEAIYALDVLKAEGLILLGSTEGVFLGDASLTELMHELDRRAAVVFVHPNLHASSVALNFEAPGFLLEFLCDTTRAALNLILSGTTEKFPAIRWILAHAGGFLPYVAWRLSLANLMKPFDERAPAGVLNYIRRFYYDTALSPSNYAMAALQHLIEPEHLLFGSDFPFAPEPLTALQVQTLEQSAVWSTQALQAIGRAHALRLLPQLGNPDDGRITPAAVPAAQGWPARLRSRLRSPVIALAERLRNR